MTMQQYTSLLIVLGMLCFIVGVWVGIRAAGCGGET